MPCNHLTKDGTPCGMAPLAGEPFCWNHSSSVASVRAKARQRGGRRNRTGYLTPPPKAAPGLRTVDAIQGQAERAFGDALLLPNGPARARVLIGALMLALKCLEVGSFEERISAVESRVSGGRL